MAKRNINEVRERAVSDFPKHAFESALRVPTVIEDVNGGNPLPPTDVAIGLNLSPGSSDFRILLSSSLKYGLTLGSYKQERIELAPLGVRATSPTSESDRRDALLAAVLTPPDVSADVQTLPG